MSSHILIPRAKLIQGRRQFGPVIPRPEGDVRKDPPAAGRLEGVLLQRSALLGRRDPGVPNQVPGIASPT